MTGSEKWNKIVEHKFLLLLIGCTAFFVFFACVLPLSFEENDDILMLLFASGKYSGTPDAHLVFINYIYGLFLTLLYSWNAGLEWYSIIFAIIHVISLSVISWKIAVAEKIKRVYKLLFLGLFLVLEIRFILYFQFTTTAALCALAGIILICCSKTFQQVLGVLLFLLAGLIRMEAAFLVLLVMSPVFLKFIRVNNKLSFSRPLYFLIIALTVSTLFKFIDYRFYQADEKWKYYYQYDMLLGHVNDNPNAGQIMNSLPAEVDTSDYALLLKFFPDSKQINSNKLTLLQQQLNDVNFKKKLNNIYPALRVYTYYLILIIITWGIIFLNCNAINKRWILVFTLLSFLAALMYVSLNGAAKYRVFFSALLPLLFVLYQSLENEKILKFNKILLLTISGFILLVAKQNYGLRNLRMLGRETLFAEQKKIMDQFLRNENNSIVPFAGSFTIQLYPAFHISESFTNRKIYFSGWASNIPYNETKYESHLDLVNRHALFFDKINFVSVLPVIQRNILKNYGVAVRPIIELESENYVIVKLVSQQLYR